MMQERKFVEFEKLRIPITEQEFLSILRKVDVISKGGTRIREGYSQYVTYDRRKKRNMFNLEKKDDFCKKIGLYVGELFGDI